jgi:polyphosphate kinase
MTMVPDANDIPGSRGDGKKESVDEAQALPADRSEGGARRPRANRLRRKNGAGTQADIGARKNPKGLDPSQFINRELSWLEFNERVLEESRDRRHPLLERVKFLSIVSSNLDEFFMIRVAAIREQVLAGVAETTPDGRTPLQQLQAIHDRVERMIRDMASCFRDDLLPALGAAGITLLETSALTAEERTSLTDLFAREIYPVLTPLAFDPGHPFPYISNLSLSLAVVVRTPEGVERFARVKVPDVLSRLVQIPGGDGTSFRFVWLEDLISANLGMLFPGMEVVESYAFRVTRNADIEIQEDEAEDLIRSIEESIRLRRFGSVARVGVQDTMPDRIKDILVENLEVTPHEVYRLHPPLGLSHLAALMKVPRPDLKDLPFHAASPFGDEETDDMFAAIRKGDIILHHPYDSFAPVVQFIRSAARDPNVLAIKQTLYRIGKESPLVPLFIEAAENGKQVAVLVELKARFDEENNIGWAKQLERAGIHVVYGLVGLKTHGKMALVVRREQDAIRRYVHLGTGNYNPVTAKIYTDMSLFTCREDITADAVEVFNFLTGYSNRDTYKKLAVAPVNLRERLTALIDREISRAKAGEQAQLVFKMNSLTDTAMIEKLYEASRAGVSIDLIVRGICCLKPGKKGLSENIRVISIVGRFLEHSRVFYFANGGAPEVYLGSADLMGRNLDHRVEIVFPVEDKALTSTIMKEVLVTALADRSRARVLGPDGAYVRAEAAAPERPDSQQVILRSRIRSTTPKAPVPREPPQES